MKNAWLICIVLFCSCSGVIDYEDELQGEWRYIRVTDGDPFSHDDRSGTITFTEDFNRGSWMSSTSEQSFNTFDFFYTIDGTMQRLELLESPAWHSSFFSRRRFDFIRVDKDEYDLIRKTTVGEQDVRIVMTLRRNK